MSTPAGGGPEDNAALTAFSPAHSVTRMSGGRLAITDERRGWSASAITILICHKEILAVAKRFKKIED
jgi:hypothetical protein